MLQKLAETDFLGSSSQQKALASELDRKTFALRHIVLRLIAVNARMAAVAHGTLPDRTEEGVGSVSAKFTSSTEKFSRRVYEAAVCSGKGMLWGGDVETMKQP